MYQNNIQDLPRLKRSNYENIFNVYTDEDGRYYYNLLQTVVIPKNLPDGYFEDYDVRYGDTWPFISYKKYGNPNIWWIITDVNNIADATVIPEPGSTLKILKADSVKLILNQISTSKLY
jgi:hypothetical protein